MGANKIEPGTFMGAGGIKSRGSQHRVMAFKDAQSHFAYMERYTQQPLVGGDDVAPAIIIRGIWASLKPLVRTPKETFPTVLDRIYKRAVTGGKRKKEMEDEAKLVARMFNSMAGLNGVASSSVFSSAVGGLRNLMTSAMLGTSVLTATSDQGNYAGKCAGAGLYPWWNAAFR